MKQCITKYVGGTMDSRIFFSWQKEKVLSKKEGIPTFQPVLSEEKN
jgi:hypothetical protein